MDGTAYDIDATDYGSGTEVVNTVRIALRSGSNHTSTGDGELHMGDRSFVVGSGRSGTTFLGKLLDSSPDALYRHEPDFFLVNTNIPFLPNEKDYDIYVAEAKNYIEQLYVHGDAKTSAIEPFFTKNFRSRSRQILFSAIARSAKLVSKSGARLSVPDLVTPGAKPKYVIKSVNSVCRVPLFSMADDSIRFIHIVRHPCAVIASLARGYRQGKMNKSLYLEDLFTMEKTHSYGLDYDYICSRSWEEQVAFQWMVHNDKVYCEMETNVNYMLVSYENLCRNISSLIRKIYAHAGLVWQDQSENYVESLANLSDTNRGYFSVNRPILSSVEKWKSDIPKETISSVEGLIAQSSVGKFVMDNVCR